MTRATLALVLLLGCTPTAVPSREASPAPPSNGALIDDCLGYCETVRRCQPDFHYPECPSDCRTLLADPEAAAVSGITAALVRCWAQARTCDLAVTCDSVAEGEGK